MPAFRAAHSLGSLYALYRIANRSPCYLRTFRKSTRNSFSFGTGPLSPRVLHQSADARSSCTTLSRGGFMELPSTGTAKEDDSHVPSRLGGQMRGLPGVLAEKNILWSLACSSHGWISQLGRLQKNLNCSAWNAGCAVVHHSSMRRSSRPRRSQAAT